LFLFLLMWVSPIGFTVDMVPANLAAVLYLNPVYYLLDVYRDSLLVGRFPSPHVALIYVGLSLLVFAVGSAFFRGFRGVLLDYEWPEHPLRCGVAGVLACDRGPFLVT